MVELDWTNGGYYRIGINEGMNCLVSQHCNECGGDSHTSKIDGVWRKVDYATQELILHNSGCCRLCGSSRVDKPFFDNGGMLIIEEEVV